MNKKQIEDIKELLDDKGPQIATVQVTFIHSELISGKVEMEAAEEVEAPKAAGKKSKKSAPPVEEVEEELEEQMEDEDQEEDEEEDEEENDEDEMSEQDLLDLFKKKRNQLKEAFAPKAKKLLNKFGVQKLTALQPNQRASFAEALNKLKA